MVDLLDIHSQCVSVTMAVGDLSLTLLEGTDYTIPVPGLTADRCLVMISSTRASGMGRTSGGGNQQPSDHGVWLGGATDGVTSINLRRNNISGTMNCRVTLQIISVANAASDSGFRVVDRGVVTFGSVDSVAQGPLVDTMNGGFNDAAIDTERLVPIIIGQQSDETSRGRTHRGKFTSEFTGNQVVLERGDTGADAMCSYALIELGSDWKPVQRLAFTSSDAGSNVWLFGSETLANTFSITGEGGDTLTDISRCWMETQFRNAVNANQGNDDQGETVELTGVDELTLRKSVHASATSKYHVVYIAEWDGPSGATPPVAEHVSNFVLGVSDGTVPYEEGGLEEGTITRTITTVADTSYASILGASCSSDGNGNGTPRGHVDLCLASATTVTEIRSETSRNERRFYTVFKWPVGDPGAPGSFAVQVQHAGPEAFTALSPGPTGTQARLSGAKASQPQIPGPTASSAQHSGAYAPRTS